MTETEASAVYDILVSVAGAPEGLRMDFVHHHTRTPICEEYRFQGMLGFGGKFYSCDMRVSCYREDDTPQRIAVIQATNEALAALKTT